MFDETIISACNLSGNIVSACKSAENINGTLFTSQLAVRAEMVGGSGSPAPTGEHNDLTGRDAEDAHPISAITNLQGELDDKADTDSLATVATSGSYNDLSDTPTPFDKRTEWVSLALMYQGFAPQGSAESDAVWTIYKIVTLATGGVVSNTEFTNKKWTERNLL